MAKGEARPALLDTYETERHATDEALIRATDLGFHLMVQPHALGDMALKLVAPNVIGLESFQERMRNILAEMNVAYPGSALSEDHGGSHGPTPAIARPMPLSCACPSASRRSYST